MRKRTVLSIVAAGLITTGCGAAMAGPPSMDPVGDAVTVARAHHLWGIKDYTVLSPAKSEACGTDHFGARIVLVATFATTGARDTWLGYARGTSYHEVVWKDATDVGMAVGPSYGEPC